MDSPDGSKGYWATISNHRKADVYCYVWMREGERFSEPELEKPKPKNKAVSEYFAKKLKEHYQLPKKKRVEHFKNYFELALNDKVDLGRHTSAYSFYAKGFGTIDYYPMGGKALIRKQNRWIDRGLEWIVKNFLD